jgi:hypothetical protein
MAMNASKEAIRHVSRIQMQCELELICEWHKWAKEIPALNFPPEWKIRIIPPYLGAIIRFVVVTEFGEVSIYLDAYDNLGGMGMLPYWEIYPGESGDPDRFMMNETTELIEGIKKAINYQKPKDVL